MNVESGDSDLPILQRAMAGDDAGLGALLESYRARLRRMIELRMDPRLKGRVDASDVIQEALIDVTSELDKYVADPRIPFYLWVRFIAGRKLQRIHEHNLGAQRRDVRRERRLDWEASPSASSIALAGALADSGPTPSQVVSDEEERGRLVAALDKLSEPDREVLALRHYEQLSSAEIATLLDTTENSVNLRYFRAVRRLHSLVQ